MKPIRLGDVCSKIGSGATPRGGKNSYLEKGPYALVRSQNVYNHGFEKAGLVFISEEQASKLSNVSVQSYDVLVNITGDSVARVCQAPTSLGPARVNQHVAIIRPDQKNLDAKFLRYFMVTAPFQEHMLAMASVGATRNALTKGMIEDFRIVAPDITEQREIAAVLGALDDKIELNRKTAATLEAMARALYRSWFVDFDPVHAKAAGRAPAHMDAATAALFPDRFGEDGLPEEWSEESLAGIATFLNGAALQKFPAGDGEDALPVIKIAELRNGVTAKSGRASVNIPDKFRITNGDVLFSWSGSLLQEIWTEGPGALNQHLFKVTSDRVPKWFHYFAVDQHMEDFRQIAQSKATTMGHIQRHHLDDALVCYPPEPVMNAADELVSPMFERLVALALENQTLATLRDTLLPRLMSGELRVGAAREQVEAAV